LRTITSAAAAAGLPFLLAGGHAVIAHGHQRATFDVDFVVRRSDRDHWLKLTDGLGYRLHREGVTFIQFNPPSGEEVPLDLMLVSDDTFAKLLAEAIPPPAMVPGGKMVSLNHLLALKCHAIKHGHPGRIVKDADDVIRLVKVNRLDLNAPGWRELFLKHGTQEFYEKVRRACRED